MTKGSRDQLRVGVASGDITPPLPFDAQGAIRRPVSASAVTEPLLAFVCFLAQGEERVVLLAADVLAFMDPDAQRIRRAIAEAVGCSTARVVLTGTHTHAAPAPGLPWKLGGADDELTPYERIYYERLPSVLAVIAREAVGRATPARVGGATGDAGDVVVNRRERTPAGVVLGWNHDGFVDSSVTVLRIDSPDGSPLAALVEVACHPVVRAMELAELTSDFVGPFRDALAATVGAPSILIQGAAGDLFPLEAYFNERGPERAFGRRLALEAAHAYYRALPPGYKIQRLRYGSDDERFVTPAFRYRRTPQTDVDNQSLRFERAPLDIAYEPPPPVRELEVELIRRQGLLREAIDCDAERGIRSSITFHIRWLQWILQAIESDALPERVTAEVIGVRIGDLVILGYPFELFSEIGARIRALSPARTTVVMGYTDPLLGYLAPESEYPFGGYELTASHRGYGRPGPFARGTADALVIHSARLIERLFERD